MKKSKRPVMLNLENLEIRVVPSQGQGFLEPHPVMGVDSAIISELENPKADNGNHTRQESDSGKIKVSTDDITAAAFENGDHHGQSDRQNQSESNDNDQSDSHHIDQTKKNFDMDSGTDSMSPLASREIESSESHSADSAKADDSKSDNSSKSKSSSEKSKSKSDSSDNLVSDSSTNSSGNSHSNSDKSSKSDDNSSSNGNSAKSEKSNSSTSSNSSNSLTDDDSTSVVSSSSQGSGDTTGSSSTKVVHGKSQSDHNTSGDSSSTDTTAVADNQPVTSLDGIKEGMISVGVRQAPALAETNSSKLVADSSNSGVLGTPLGLEANTASIASTAAVLSANQALVQVPAVVDAAIPLAIPVLQSFAPSLGLGELAAMDTLAPVAGDLIVGFLPVEQMNLGATMQGVLSEIDALGEQVIGSGAGKWLYPIVFTALAATTVFQLATRRRRQVQRQSVWATESGIWSGSYFGRP